jgi:hypothetical protein
MAEFSLAPGPNPAAGELDKKVQNQLHPTHLREWPAALRVGRPDAYIRFDQLSFTS